MEDRQNQRRTHQITRTKAIACGICTGVQIASLVTLIGIALFWDDEVIVDNQSDSSEVVETTVTTSADKVQETAITTTISEPEKVTTTTAVEVEETTVEASHTTLPIEFVAEVSKKPEVTTIIPDEEITTTTSEEYIEPEMDEYYWNGWDGEVLTASAGRIQGPSGPETYYNLDMSGVIANMSNLGYDYTYSIREDGVKLFGGYVMVAADLEHYSFGDIVQTSLGTGIVVDTGYLGWDQLDISVTW